jgi:DNA-binding NarL/FixJ family response regulator
MGGVSESASSLGSSNFVPRETKGKIRVLVADDHAVIASGLCTLLESSQECEVVAVARTGREAAAKACETRPDVVVLDINMPVLNGVEATRAIRSALPETEVLILTAYESEQLAQAILCAGARGYILKSDTARDLVLAVESLASGRPFFSASLAQTILNGYLQSRRHEEGDDRYTLGLTGYERQILQLLAEGYSNKEVASLQGITTRTAETHRANIMRKLKLRSISDVVRFAVRNQIIQA